MPGDQDRPDAQASTLRSLQTALLRGRFFFDLWNYRSNSFGDGFLGNACVVFITGLFRQIFGCRFKEGLSISRLFGDCAPAACHFDPATFNSAVGQFQQLATHSPTTRLLKCRR